MIAFAILFYLGSISLLSNLFLTLESFQAGLSWLTILKKRENFRTAFDHFDYSKVVVRKPWGYEYLIFSNAHVAVWILSLEPNSQTSMHCHPNKTTGLIVLDGACEINFLSNKFIVEELDKTMIRKSLFHSTKSIAENG